MNRVTIKIRYKASGNSTGPSFIQENLGSDYIIQMRPNGLPQAGGVVDSLIEIFLNISFEDFFRLVRDGIAWDLLTRGKDSFVLKPIIKTFQELEKSSIAWDYTYVKFMFDDSEIIIYGVKNLFTSKVGPVVQLVAQYFYRLIDNELGTPYQIIIPLTKTDEDGQEQFVNDFGNDEYELVNYQSYWGVVYSLGYERKVFDLKNEVLINTGWKG